MKPFTDKLINEKIRRAFGVIKDGVYRKVADLSAEYAVTEEPVPFSERLSLSYRPIREGERWCNNGLWDCGWFHITGKAPKPPKGCELCLALDFEGEGCLFDGTGTPIRGITNVSSEFDRMLGMPGKRYIPFSDNTFAVDPIDLWVETGNNDLFGNARTGTVKECAVVACDTERRALYYDYALLLDLAESTPDTDPLHYALLYALERVAMRAEREMSAERIAECREILRPHLERKNAPDPLLRFYAVGHSHLDLAWLWPIRETRRKAGRTFSTALANLKAYPDYVYGASQPQQFDWVKKDYPALYAKLQEAVRAGRMEVQGGMWVEADTNITGAESLVRQFLYGKRFWKEEFGKDVDTLWLPDVFGFSGALPQIMLGCGCENFLTIKLSWNMVNEFPFHSFRWQGIDGSEVLVHMPPEGSYNSPATPRALRFAAGNYSQRGISENAMLLYGIGDGGGGPGRDHLEFLAREKDLYGVPNVVNAPSTEFFKALKQEACRLPVYKGDIYLERHQGTYTSQAANKYYNRLLENALAKYEAAQVACGDKDRKFADEIWKEVLLYQFHDILPGSSIARVYDECVPRYKEMYSAVKNAFVDLLARRGNTACVFNATSYDRDEYIQVDGKWYHVQTPPFAAVELGRPTERFSVYSEDGIFGNDSVEVSIGSDGRVLSIVDKKCGRQLLAEPSGGFVAYNDVGDAWDFYGGYVRDAAQTVELRESHPFVDGARAGVRQRFVCGDSVITQEISVTESSSLVRFDVVADWRETEKMLRADFFPAISTDEVCCDIQWGNVRRRMTENNGIEAAQYEICAHKWVDMSQTDYGVALINDCKYGYRCKDGLISIDLLRSQMHPCVNQDKGTHRFSYAVYGHAGSVDLSDVAARAYAFNRPLELVHTQPFGSLAVTDNSHVVIETVKPAENNDGFIVRLYNDTPQPQTAKLSVNGIVTVTDMLERKDEATDGDLRLRGFEIMTLRVRA